MQFTANSLPAKIGAIKTGPTTTETVLRTRSFRSWDALGAGLLLLACGSNRNDAERRAYAEANGYIKENCVNSCMKDTGGDPVGCEAAEKGLEFFDVDILNFEAGKATSMFAYDDGSDAFRFPGNGWEPDAVTYPEDDQVPGAPEDPANQIRIAQRCEGTKSNSVFHLLGGPFFGYGGGLGVGLKNLLGGHCSGDKETDPEYCNSGVDVDFPGYEFDLTAWDGVSLWARRGPESQSVLRVGVSERHTDDDLSYMATYNKLTQKAGASTATYCERFRECGCRNHKPCTEFTDSPSPGIEPRTCMVCYDPETDEPPPSCAEVEERSNQNQMGAMNPITGEVVDSASIVRAGQYEACGQFACNLYNNSFQGNTDFSDGADPQFNGKPCTPYYMRGGRYGEFCFDPEKDPPPPESNDQCGDGTFAPITLSTKWQFFKIRFEDMAQQGWAKESFRMDIDRLTGLRLTYDRGWVDYWVDDVRFYREAK